MEASMNTNHNHDAINNLKRYLTICETDADLFWYQRDAQSSKEDTWGGALQTLPWCLAQTGRWG
jgi:hypothetical protein